MAAFSRVLGLLALIASGSAHAAECFSSLEAVRKADPGAWPSWTLRMPGHEGTRCWYPGTRGVAYDPHAKSIAAARSVSHDDHAQTGGSAASNMRTMSNPLEDRPDLPAIHELERAADQLDKENDSGLISSFADRFSAAYKRPR
jgi:hypothetical protein